MGVSLTTEDEKRLATASSYIANEDFEIDTEFEEDVDNMARTMIQKLN